MTSLFSRARTKSTTRKNFSPEGNGIGNADEFGRAPSRGGLLGTPSKKDKKKGSKAVPSLEEEPFTETFPDGAFLPLNLERPRHGAANSTSTAPPVKLHDYGYLSYDRHVVLGLEQLERLVEVISEELETRGGITTPFIFSNTALDISSSAIRRLIRAFLNTCDTHSEFRAQEAENKWREEARFASPHELGMCLRWGLARVIRSVGGQDVRGLVSWEHYVEFRETEAEHAYPSTHFATQFLPPLIPTLQAIIIRLLSLLTRLIANSTCSGHTPPTLSPLFGPLFFGLGPATLTFHHAYIHYLRAVTAMEHLILAFIRWQDTPRVVTSPLGGGTASAATLGVPVRLKEWIKGYPGTLPVLDIKKPQPRRGARTTRVMSVRRNVRMYSPDLLKTASTWAHKAPESTHNGLANSKEWERIAPPTLKLPPRYSESYKKKMDLKPGFHPEIAPGAVSGTPSTMSTSSSVQSSATTTSAATSLLPDIDYFGLGEREREERFRSLTDLKWGEFESIGFNHLEESAKLPAKLQFDLTESARTERKTKRQTLSWNDFTSDGFSRSDAPLSATLQFSTPFTAMISSWPSQNAEITKKLKKTHKALPAFGWDTEPVVGSEEVIEDAFVDAFCDLIYGGGWMDLERGEMLDRDCNWALVEFKSLPPARTTTSGVADPRTHTTLVLFEEFVPLEYREQLAIKSSNRRRLPSLFSSSGKKHWKQAATLNGRPYVIGHVPVAPSPREVEFEGLLHGNSSTRILSLNPKRSASGLQTSFPNSPAEPMPMPVIKVPRTPEKRTVAQPRPPKSDDAHSDSTPAVKRSIFRPNRKSMIPAEYSTVEFETRMASYSDDEANGKLEEPEDVKQRRRESSADAWVDIMVGSPERSPNIEAVDKRRDRRGRRSDPDLAQKELAQVLATVQNRSPSPPSVVDRVDRDYGMDQHIDHHISDTDVVEVERVPRMSRSMESGETGNQTNESGSANAADVDTTEMDDATPAALNARQVLRQQRRLGYFDLHPERRKGQAQSIVDDPRAKLATDSDGEDDDEPYVPPISVPPTSVPPTSVSPTSVRPLPIPPLTPSKPIVIHEPAPVTPIKSIVQNLNQSPDAKLQGNGTSPPITSKTAALIEMYRERERGNPLAKPAAVSNGSPTSPSRLPVRAPLPKEPAAAAATTTTTTTTTIPAVAIPPPPTGAPPSEPEHLNIDAPRAPFDETGRASPVRYVHGAPLHNVLEEEEEEEGE